MRIGVGKIGVRMRKPRRLHDPHRAPHLMRLALIFGGQHRRRHQRRRELCRFQRERLSIVAIGLLRCERTRREHHRALAAIALLVERPSVGFEERKRAGPVAGEAAEFEHRFAGPAERWADARRLLCKCLRAGVVAAASRLDEEPVQAKRFGVGPARHGAEGAVGRLGIAAKLRRLRMEKKR